MDLKINDQLIVNLNRVILQILSGFLEELV